MVGLSFVFIDNPFAILDFRFGIFLGIPKNLKSQTQNSFQFVRPLKTSSRLWLSLCKETMLRLCCKASSKICLRNCSGLFVSNNQLFASDCFTDFAAERSCSNLLSIDSLKLTFITFDE